MLTATSAKVLSESTRHFGFSLLDFKICEEDFKGSAFMGLSPASIQNLKSKMLLITLSARDSTLGGIVNPICLAVLRLITNSNFVGCFHRHARSSIYSLRPASNIQDSVHVNRRAMTIIIVKSSPWLRFVRSSTTIVFFSSAKLGQKSSMWDLDVNLDQSEHNK